jgi:hypothetical protein
MLLKPAVRNDRIVEIKSALILQRLHAAPFGDEQRGGLGRFP